MALFGRETREDQERAQAYARWLQQRNPLAIISVVLGTFSLIEMGIIPVFSVGGLVCGIVSLRQLAQPSAAAQLGRRLAWFGIIISSIALAVGAGLYVHSFFIAR